MPERGDPAPDFTLPSDVEGDVRLSDLRGEKVVLFFYPKDDTSGCTVEVCEFRDAMPRFDTGDVRVFGISPDPVASHLKFREKHGLTFPLLADEDHGTAEAYGVWKEKSMYGRKFWGIERTTFLVDEEGSVEHVWRRVKPRGHAAEVAARIGSGE